MLLEPQSHRKMTQFIASCGRAIRVMKSPKWLRKGRSTVFCTQLGVQKLCFHYLIYAKNMVFSAGLQSFEDRDL